MNTIIEVSNTPMHREGTASFDVVAFETATAPAIGDRFNLTADGEGQYFKVFGVSTIDGGYAVEAARVVTKLGVKVNILNAEVAPE